MEHSAGGADGGRASGEPAAIQSQQLEVFAKGPLGVIRTEDPFVQFRTNRARKQRVLRGDKNLARIQGFERIRSVSRIYFGNSKFAGRYIDVGNSRAVGPGRDRRQEVVLMRAE